MLIRTFVRSTFITLVLWIATPVQGGTTTIYFDDVQAPLVFSETVALTEVYSGLGVYFYTESAGDGGAILDEYSNFGVDAHSGRNFLAFNSGSRLSDGGVPHNPETILFDTLMSEVSIYVAGGETLDSFTMMAYDAAGLLVDTDMVTTQSWALLSVASPDGIRTVVLEQTGEDSIFVYDDLSFTVLGMVPSPGAIVLSTLGAGLVGWLRRRRSL